MATVWVKPPARKGGNYRVYWQVGGRGGPRASLNCGPSKQYAEACKAQKRLELLGRATGLAKAVTVACSVFADQYLAYSRAHKAKNTAENFDAFAMRILKTRFGSQAVAAVTRGQTEALKMDLLKTLAPATVSMRLRALRTAFNYARRLHLTLENPFAGITLPKATDPGRVLTPEEIQLLVGALAAPVARAVWFAVNTGLRLGELLTLDWKRVRPGVCLEIPKVLSKGGKARLVTLNAAARALLGPPGAGRVFWDVSRDMIHAHLRAAVLRLKLGHVRFHDLRHTWATNFMLATGDLPALMLEGGWSTLAAVQKYQHLSRGRMLAAAAVSYDCTPSVPPMPILNGQEKIKITSKT